MKTTLRFACLLALTCLLTAFSAHAQTLRLYVASYGNDGNDGTRLSPKRTFQAAHDAMSSGGNIEGLDTAGYATGTLNITKDLSITMAPGCEGIVTASGGNGITINTGLRVSLRGLRIEAKGGQIVFNGGSGIYVQSARSVEVDHCTITGFGIGGPGVHGSGGIIIATSGVTGHVVVTDTVIKHCGGSGISFGYFATPTDSTLVVERCQLLGNGQGLGAYGLGDVTVQNCVISHNAQNGIQGGGTDPFKVKVHVEHCAVTGNDTGIYGWTAGSVTVSNTSITGNTTGVLGAYGVSTAPSTFGNNQLINNTTDGSFGPLVGLK
jgi:nitrous oxidase accessory protein NosD